MSREPHTLGAKPLLVLVARIDLELLLPNHGTESKPDIPASNKTDSSSSLPQIQVCSDPCLLLTTKEKEDCGVEQLAANAEVDADLERELASRADSEPASIREVMNVAKNDADIPKVLQACTLPTVNVHLYFSWNGPEMNVMT